MKTEPITPARIDWSGEAPRAADYDDIYRPRAGAFVQAEHVFLHGNGLPGRWRGRERFTIVETGFGLGLNFLAAWAAWRADDERCTRLHFVSIEKHPPVLDDLRRAHAGQAHAELAAALHAQWPPLTPNLHALDFDGGRVRLLLAFGDVAQVLPALEVRADAFFLDGFVPERNPAMWDARLFEALRRRAAPGATAATWSVARTVRDGLARAGFEVERAAGSGGKREISVARHVLRTGLRAPPAWEVRHAIGAERRAIVIGAGIAGACTAAALHDDGWEVTVLDRRAPSAADATSRLGDAVGAGALGGLFHGTLNIDDGPHARLLRSAALQAARLYAPAIASGTLTGSAQGLLRLEPGHADVDALHALAARCGLPADYVRPLAAVEAARLAGVPVASPGWFYPGGGWVSPADAVHLALQGTRCVLGRAAARLERSGARWRVLDASGRVIDEAVLVVLCAAAGTAALLAALGGAPWPTQRTRGQVSVLAQPAPTALALPLAGDGYALPLADGSLLCGATRQTDDDDGAVRDADHRFNAERARRLTGLDLPLAPQAWHGHVGWRLQADDRMPIAGPVPAAPRDGGSPHRGGARLRDLPREEGLFVVTALGTRGLTLAPLLGRLVAAMAGGTPWPIERDLAAAVDPGRWLVRAQQARDAARPVSANDDGLPIPP